MYEVGAVVLGYVGAVASWRRLSPTHQSAHRTGLMVTITVAASTDEGAHEPAQSISLNNRVALLALRSAIDEALKEGAAA